VHPGPCDISYVRRATVCAHTIPNLKPEIRTKHCVTPFLQPQSPMVSASFSKLMEKMLAWRTASALHVCSACIEQGARQ
jgi:hypothetical protein